MNTELIKMNTELIKRYKLYQKNLSHNIKFDLDKIKEYENNPYYNEELKEKEINLIKRSIENAKGQLMIVREIIFDLQDKRNYYYYASLNFKLGEV